jgi:hypothetical protein
MPGSSKRKPRKLKLRDRAQSERFIETARRLAVDETGEKFRKALRRVIPPKKH